MYSPLALSCLVTANYPRSGSKAEIEAAYEAAAAEGGAGGGAAFADLLLGLLERGDAV